MLLTPTTLRRLTAGLGATVLSCLLGLVLLPNPTAPAQDGEGAKLPVVRIADGERVDLEVRGEDLTWLEGNWKGSDGQSDWESVYTGARGGMVVGASKELRGERVVMTDFEHFYMREGALRMTPYPRGKQSAEFTLSEYDAAERRAVFSNPEHDFPHTFIYHRVADERLKITLFGDMGGGEMSFTLDFKRVD